jgi:RNA polymerase-binding transcription factor DksA
MHYHYFTLEQRANLEQAMRSEIRNPSALSRALEHLHNPQYGVCRRCGGDIPYIRLTHRPLAQDCGRCS